MSPNAGGGGGASANEYSYAHGAQINFGDLTPYFTYALAPHDIHYFADAYSTVAYSPSMYVYMDNFLSKVLYGMLKYSLSNARRNI